MSLAAAVENGPAARQARRAHVEARIALAETKARKARDRAAAHRRKAKGGQGWHAAQVAIHEAVADDQTRLAHRLRTKLAKDDAAHARKHAAQTRRGPLSTAAAGLVPRTPGHPGQEVGQGGQGGQPVKTRGGHMAKQEPAEPGVARCTWTVSPYTLSLIGVQVPCGKPATDGNFCAKHAGEAAGTPCVKCGQPLGSNPDCSECRAARTASSQDRTPTQPKGSPMTAAVSGEAVDLEQANATLDQLDALAAEIRSATENASSSLASGGLAKVAGSLSAGDDAIDSYQAALKEARQNLAPHQEIAEAVQAAGEMHRDPAFYGA